jgi:hypothetical protein
MKVTARQIKQSADLEVAEQFGKGLPQFSGVVEG